MSYNIPSVDSYVVDQSTLLTKQTSGRCVLIPYFGKYGSEDLEYIYKSDSVEIPSIGKENPRLYGNSVKFIKTVLSINNCTVLGCRLLPSDATYANKIFTYVDGTTTPNSRSKIIDKNSVLTIGNYEIAFIAKHRGVGYNDIFVVVRPDESLSLSFADDFGSEMYRNNFYTASVYEKTPDGDIMLENNIQFSLMETDEFGVSFKNPKNGQNLFIEESFKKFSNFINVKISDELLDDLYDNPNAMATGVGLPILEDTVTGGAYKVELDVSKELKLVRVEIDETVPNAMLDNGSKTFKIEVTNKKLVISETDETTDVTKLVIDGYDNIFEFSIDDDGVYNTDTIYKTPRNSIAKEITSSRIYLTNGYDGANLSIKNRFNLDGLGENSKENAKMLLIDFYNGNADIHNTTFPKYDFAYVPDHSGDDDVKSAINNLTTTIRLSLGIVASNFATSHKDDVEWREEVFYASNMHTAIYSGQTNLTHFDESVGADIPMSSVLYALVNHLVIDTTMSITEPMANTVKGQLPVAGAELSYKPQPAHIEELIRKGVNCIVDESDGKYFITQMTSYKKSSKLTRINNVKTIHAIRKALPPLLKDLLQNKALSSIVNEARRRVEFYMEKWEVRDDNPRDGIFTSIDVKPFFDETENILYIYISVVFVGIIEKISIPIIVK